MEPIEQVTSAITEWKRTKPVYDSYRSYFDGNHQLRFATADFEAKYGAQVKSLRENLCRGAVTAFTDRLSIASWGDRASLDIATEEGLSRLVGFINTEAFRCGDSYALVWEGPDGKPVPHYHRADQIVPHANPDDPATLDWAAKVWVDGSRYGRVNVYDAEKVTRWRTAEPFAKDSTPNFPEKPEAWVPHTDDVAGEIIGHRFGAVPVCWWRQDADDQAGRGVSILADVIPLQDALNKSVADLVVTGEAYSRPFRYLLNYKPNATNPLAMAGEYLDAMRTAIGGSIQRKFNPSKQQIFTHDGGGPMGQFDPADLEKLVKVQDAFAVKIGRVIGVPPYYLTQTSGDVPSGQALRVLTSRLVARVASYQRDSGPVFRGLAQLLGMPDANPEWADPMGLDPMERWQVAQIQKSLGYPLVDILLGLGEADAEGIAERAQAATSQSVAVMGKALRDGQVGF